MYVYKVQGNILPIYLSIESVVRVQIGVEKKVLEKVGSCVGISSSQIKSYYGIYFLDAGHEDA